MRENLLEKKYPFFISPLIILLSVILAGIVIFSVFQLISSKKSQEISDQKEIHISVNDTLINVKAEIARTPDQQEKGLMYREKLESDRGMLFIFDKSQIQSFWMKNTLIPLDIIFFDEAGNFLNAENAYPCTSADNQCTIYKSVSAAKYVLEVNEGWAKKNGIQKGSILDISRI